MSGCSRTTQGYSPYCSTHRTTARKHGHAEQKAVRRSELRPYEEIVQKYLRNNPDAGAWKVMDQIWRDRVREARELIRAYENGKPCSTHERRAAAEIIKMDRDCDWQEIMAVVAAAWMLQEDRPQRLKSDDAMRFQAARLARQIVPAGGRRYIDQNGNERIRQPYISPRQTRVLGQWLIEAFAPLGMRLLGLEEEERGRRELMQQELASGLASLR